MNINAMGLQRITVSPHMTSYRSGLPINDVPEEEMTDAEHYPLLKKYQTWISMLNWLGISTHPDMAPVVSLLYSYLSKPSSGHLDAAKYTR